MTVRGRASMISKQIRKKISKIFRDKRSRSRFTEFFKLISQSPLFDESFYIASANKFNLSVGHEGAICHYIEIGDIEGVPTHPLFDTRFYRDNYPDLETIEVPLLVHFLKHGAAELRRTHPYVDPEYVLGQIYGGADNYLIYYLNSSIGEINPHPLIDENYIVGQTGRFQSKHSFVSALDHILSESSNPSFGFDTIAYKNLFGSPRLENPVYHYLAANKVGEIDRYVAKDLFLSINAQVAAIADQENNIMLGETPLRELRAERAVHNKTKNARAIQNISMYTGQQPIDHMVLFSSFEDEVATSFLVRLLESEISCGDACNICLITDSNPSSYKEMKREHSSVIVLSISDVIEERGRWEMPQIISLYIQIQRVSNLHIIESEIGWDLLEKYGKQNQLFTKIHAHVPGYSRNSQGRKAGYAWSHLPECKKYLTSLTTNCPILIEDFKDEMREEGSGGLCNIILVSDLC
ncbi:hypothetical protein [Methylorubrum thiocyanatum]|uniref:hypothetical protein n=1 Tax=Methylorubrum thiocyanatum TaxID=47958 RepID=UPI003649889B